MSLNNWVVMGIKRLCLTVGIFYSGFCCATEVEVDEVIVPSDGSTVESIDLSLGGKYRLSASGTYNWSPNGDSADAAGWVSTDGWTTKHPRSAKNLVGGDVDWAAFPYNQNGYSAEIIGQGKKLTFNILDDAYGDNSGSLTVKITYLGGGEVSDENDETGATDPYVGDPIAPNGNFFLQVTDFICRTAGLTFQFSRIYNSCDANGGPLGARWHHSYLTRVETNGAETVLVRQDAKRETYALTNGVFTIQGDPWSGDLVKTADGWRFRDKSNVDWLYGTNGALTSVQDRNGNALSLSRSGSGALTNVADAAGRGVAFRYDGAGLLTNVADWAGRSVTYGYTNVGGLNCLSEVQDVRGFKTVYGYGTNGVLTTVTDANGRRTVENVYDNRRRVVSQTDAFTNRTEIAY